MASYQKIEKGNNIEGRLIRVCFTDKNGEKHVKSKRYYPDYKMTSGEIDKAAEVIANQMLAELQAAFTTEPEVKTTVPDAKNKKQMVTLQEYYNGRFIQRRKLKKNIRQTTEEYYRNLGTVICEYYGDKLLNEITPEDIDDFLEYLAMDYEKKDGKPLALNTIYKYYRIMKTLFNTAVRDRVCVSNPADEVEPPAKTKVRVIAMDEDEEGKFVDNLANESLKLQAYALIGVHGGLRRGEIIGLQWKDVDWENHALSVQRSVTVIDGGTRIGKPKTDNSGRIAFVSDIAIEALSKYYAEQKPEEDDYIFASPTDPKKPQNPTNMTRAIKRYCKRIGIPEYTSHQLRHTCGTLMNARGSDTKSIQEQLGHSDSAITNKFYIRDLPEHRKQMVKQAFDRKMGDGQ